MRIWLRATTVALLLCGVARAQAPAPSPASAPAASLPSAPAVADGAATPLPSEAPAAAPEWKRQFGVGLDVGLPDGLTLSGIYRPIKLVRIELGLGYNALSPGIRLGATLTPIDFWISPSLTVEAGHYFPGNNDSIMHLVVGDTGVAAQTFKDVTYNFANVQVGAEFGSSRFAGFLHVGYSYVSGTINNFQTHLQAANAGDNGTLTAQDPSVRLTAPSVKLGMIFYFG